MKYSIVIDNKEKTIDVPENALDTIYERVTRDFQETQVPKEILDEFRTGHLKKFENNEWRDITESNYDYIDCFMAEFLPYYLAHRDNIVFPNNISLKTILKLHHRGYDAFDSLMSCYYAFGDLPKGVYFYSNDKNIGDGSEAIEEELRTMFQGIEKNHGTVPRILHELAITYMYREGMKDDGVEVPPLSAYADKWNTAHIKKLVDAGLPIAFIATIYTSFPANKLEQIANYPQVAMGIAQLMLRGERESDPQYILAAKWLSEHLNSSEDLIENLYKNASSCSFKLEDTVATVTNMLFSKPMEKFAKTQIKDIEKRYKKPKFKFEDCVCEMKGVEEKVYDGRYVAYIMDGQDERQVVLAYNLDSAGNPFNDSCQRFEDAGESAMMYGLIMPTAGFFVIEDTTNGSIKAYAEIWEQDPDTMVFDNIEFKNDADVELYKGILGKWISQSEYKNVKMGTGYNQAILGHNGEFRYAGKINPPVNARVCYVISYEAEGEGVILKSERDAQEKLDNGEISSTTYVYTDAGDYGTTVWLKQNNTMEPYFAKERITRQQMEDMIQDIGKDCFAPYDMINAIMENNGIYVLPGETYEEEYEEEEEEEYEEEEMYDEEPEYE